MKIRLDRDRHESFLDQTRDQIISALHAGLMRRGDRLPSLRQVAGLSSLNVKTVMRVYTQLQQEGLVVLRRGSGAFLAVHDPGGFEPAQAVSLGRLLRRHLDEAAGMSLTPATYAALVQRLVSRSALKDRSVAVLECNEEQVRLISKELTTRIGVKAHPILLEDLGGKSVTSILRACSIVAVTDFHVKEGSEIAKRFHKPLVRVRLRRDYLPAIMEAARRGRLTMIVSSTAFVPAFKRALGLLGLQREYLDRIAVVGEADRGSMKRAVATADAVYISPLCEHGLRGLVPRSAHLLSFTHHLASDSVEELEAWLLLSTPESLKDSGDSPPAR
jgi:DNA-binding transcriptional regulator YhcF (GntR family)